jgi:hypothetical protein
MVRWLVEQEQIGRPEQQTAQCDAATLTARQLCHLRIGGRQAKRVHGELQPRIEIPPVGRFDAILDLALLVEDLVHLLGRQLFPELRVDLVVPREKRAHVGHAFLDVSQHRLGGIEPRFLVEVADRGAGRREGFAEEVRFLAGHDLQQRALPRAVQAKHADLGARQERQPDIFENDMVWLMDLAQTFHGVDVLSHRSR